MKSIDKIREWSRWLDRAYVTSDGSTYTVYSHKPYDGMKSCGEHMREQCNEIEHEIAERYMPAPLDADGVPIRVGDTVEYPNGSKDVVRFVTINDNEPTFNEMGWIGGKCRHVKPRTLEDVLRDAMQYGHDDATVGERAEAQIDKYAAEIRELLRGDVE